MNRPGSLETFQRTAGPCVSLLCGMRKAPLKGNQAPKGTRKSQREQKVKRRAKLLASGASVGSLPQDTVRTGVLSSSHPETLWAEVGNNAKATFPGPCGKQQSKEEFVWVVLAQKWNQKQERFVGH